MAKKISMAEAMKAINAAVGMGRGTGNGSASYLTAEEKEERRLARQDTLCEYLVTGSFRIGEDESGKEKFQVMNPAQVIQHVFRAVRAGLSANALEVRTGGVFRTHRGMTAEKWELPVVRGSILAVAAEMKRPKDNNKKLQILNEVLRAFLLPVATLSELEAVAETETAESAPVENEPESEAPESSDAPVAVAAE